MVGYMALNHVILVRIQSSQEAKLCSDGSAVGRTGPKCEFAVCPRLIPG